MIDTAGGRRVAGDAWREESEEQSGASCSSSAPFLPSNQYVEEKCCDSETSARPLAHASMSEDVTKCATACHDDASAGDDPWAALSPAKQAAALALLAGRTPAEAGRQAGASRRTVYRWMQEPAFRAALAEAQAELREAVSARLMAVADDAVLCIEWRIKEGDGRLALQLLRSLGLLGGWPAAGAGGREEGGGWWVEGLTRSPFHRRCIREDSACAWGV